MNLLFTPTDKFKVQAFMRFHPSFRAKYGEPVHTRWMVKRKVYVLGIPIWLWCYPDDKYSLLNFSFWEDKEFQEMVKPFEKNNYSNIKQVFFK